MNWIVAAYWFAAFWTVLNLMASCYLQAWPEKRERWGFGSYIEAVLMTGLVTFLLLRQVV